MRKYSSTSTSNPAASGDPFYVFKDELESKVSAVNQKHTKWKTIWDAPDSSSAKDLPALTTQIENAVAAADKSLKFLDETIVMVEANRSKFEHIDAAEISSRKAFVTEKRKELQAVSTEISSDAVKARIRKVERKLLKPTQSSKDSSSPSGQEDNERFMADEAQRQKQLIKEQDESVEGLATSVTQLNSVAVEISTEVVKQNKMLDDLGDDVDDAQERMNFVMGRMSKLLKTKDKCQLGLIIFLVLVFIVMVFLVVYT